MISKILGKKFAPSARVVSLKRGRGFTFPIVGESHYQRNLEKIVGGKSDGGAKFETDVFLAREADNPHDQNAVCVIIKNLPVGYLPREKARQYVAYMDQLGIGMSHATCRGKIVGGWKHEDGHEGSFGVRLSLSWPPKLTEK